MRVKGLGGGARGWFIKGAVLELGEQSSLTTRRMEVHCPKEAE